MPGQRHPRTPPPRPERVLPQGLVDRARRFASSDESERTVVEPRPAATVVLLRDVGTSAGGTAGGGLEVYLLRRVSSMAFAAGMHVFPGGTVDPRDVEAGFGWHGDPPREWARVFRTDVPLASALVCAAVRETFEEAGVLLAGASGDSVLAETTGADWEQDRQALVDRSLSFAELLNRRGLVLRADLLRPWSHWITPVFEERRYDTRFFVAGLPAAQRPRDVGGEADRVAWMRPDEAVQRHADGQLAMLAPTVTTLAELAGYDTVSDVLAAGWERDVHAVTPRAVFNGDQVHVALPGEPGYEAGLTVGEQ